MLTCLSKVHALSHHSDTKEKNMVRLIIGFTVHPNLCTPKLAAILGTEFPHSSHLPTYIEVMANDDQVISSFMLPS